MFVEHLILRNSKSVSTPYNMQFIHECNMCIGTGRLEH